MSEQTKTDAPKTETPESAAKKAALAKIGPDLMAAFRDVEEAYNEIHNLFKNEGLEKEAEFFEAQKIRTTKMMGWYDPKAKSKARIDRLKQQLAKLEQEAEGDN